MQSDGLAANDIHQLIKKMDDILDLIEDSAQLMFRSKLRSVYEHLETFTAVKALPVSSRVS